jgi:hypothetical protein
MRMADVRLCSCATLLARIERGYPGFLRQHVDLIAGSSTGGLIALLLGAGYTPEECVDVYMVRCDARRPPLLITHTHTHTRARTLLSATLSNQRAARVASCALLCRRGFRASSSRATDG